MRLVGFLAFQSVASPSANTLGGQAMQIQKGALLYTITNLLPSAKHNKTMS